MTSQIHIPGYTYGTSAVAQSPISKHDFDLLKQTVLFSAEDIEALRLAGTVLVDQIDAILDVWYGFVGSQSYLVHYFSGADGQPDSHYLSRVRERFGQWIRDTCNRQYDQDWLNYQMEIGLRHTAVKKNHTDQVQSVPLIPLRYMIAFIVPITITIKPFLAAKGHSAEQVEAMYTAWFKALTLQVVLWSYPYVPESAF